MSAAPDRIELPADGRELGVVVALHGRGSAPEDIIGLCEALRLPSVRFVAPRAPQAAGWGSYAWYSRPYTDTSPSHHIEVERARKQVRELLDELAAEATRVGVLGFSQGGVLALDAALHLPRSLAACVVLSGGVYDPDGLAMELTSEARDTPVLWLHGIRDPILPIEPARRQADGLRALSVTLDFREYPIEHTVSAAELTAVRVFLTGRMGYRVADP